MPEIRGCLAAGVHLLAFRSPAGDALVGVADVFVEFGQLVGIQNLPDLRAGLLPESVIFRCVLVVEFFAFSEVIIQNGGDLLRLIVTQIQVPPHAANNMRAVHLGSPMAGAQGIVIKSRGPRNDAQNKGENEIEINSPAHLGA